MQSKKKDNDTAIAAKETVTNKEQVGDEQWGQRTKQIKQRIITVRGGRMEEGQVNNLNNKQDCVVRNVIATLIYKE